MRFVCAVVFLIALLKVVSAHDEALSVECYSRAEWTAWKEDLRGFDEIQMYLAAKPADFPEKWTKNGIEFRPGWILNSPLHHATEIKDSASFLELLTFEPHVPKTMHGCYGLFNLCFYRKGELVGSLHYAHGQYWNPLTKASQAKVNQWLIAHGFPIEKVLKEDHPD